MGDYFLIKQNLCVQHCLETSLLAKIHVNAYICISMTANFYVLQFWSLELRLLPCAQKLL